MKKNLRSIGSLVIIGAFVYYVNESLKHAIQLNPATWVMWSVLDIFLAYSMLKGKNEGAAGMVGFAIGATLVALISYVQIQTGKTSWSWSTGETFTAVCFCVAFAARFIANNDPAKICWGTTAMLIAGIPTLIDALSDASHFDPLFWGICTAGCLIMLAGTPKGFSRMYFPVGGTILNGLITILAMSAR